MKVVQYVEWKEHTILNSVVHFWNKTGHNASIAMNGLVRGYSQTACKAIWEGVIKYQLYQMNLVNFIS